VPGTAWQRRSCGDGAKGPLLYDRALVDAGEHHRLLIRRSLTPNAKGVRELAYFLCHIPDPVVLDVLVRAAGSRWAVEECFQSAKYGYAQEYGMEQRLRDVMAVEIADGTAQVQKIIIARERFGSGFVPYAR
jgi:hypothetical protein